MAGNVSNSEESECAQQPPYFDRALIIDTRLSEIERQRREERVEQQRHAHSQRFTNWLLTVFTGLLFIASIASNVLILRQLRIAEKSTDAAIQSSQAAQRSVALAEGNTKDAERTFRLQMRPYLVLSGVDPMNFKLVPG